MKIFISWSGPRSQALAQALREWLPLVLHYTEPWLSEADLAAGERWAHALAKELESSNFGIICVTRENVSSPWVLFEAGSLAKSLEGSRVIPLLLDVEFSEISGPLAQFQAKKAEREDLGEIIQSINGSAPNPVPEARTRQLFEALWPELEKQLATIPAAVGSKPIRPQHEILEELVASVRALDSRIGELRELVFNESLALGRPRRRFDPHFLLEGSHMIAERPDDPVQLLYIASLVREDMPWLYELAMEAYRALKDGDTENSQTSLRRFRRGLEMGARGMFREGSSVDPKTFHIILRDVERILSREAIEDDSDPNSRRRRGSKGEPTSG